MINFRLDFFNFVMFSVFRKTKRSKMMYSSKDLKKEVYKLGEVAKFVGVTTGTLRRWESLGKVEFSKTDYGTRSLTKEKLIELLKANNL